MTLPIPPALTAALQQLPGFDEAAFLAAHTRAAVTSIRLNPARPAVQPGFALAEKVPWCSTGWYLAERPLFTTDPLLHAGAYYVQEASSMFVEEALRQCCDLSRPLRVLDLCAAPGGKSTLLQQALHPQSLLVSNEVIKTRVNILAENITKWGAANVVVTSNDPQHFQRLPHFFDVVLADAPCSGSGLFRRDPAAIDEWSENNVALCSQRQQRILADVLPALKPGGLLIYATCSYSPQEDEAIVDWLTTAAGLTSLPLTPQPGWGITMAEGSRGCRFFPHLAKGEGFFIACLRKPEENSNMQLPKPAKQLPVPAKLLPALHGWLQHPEDYHFLYQQEEILAIPQWLQQDLATLQAALYIKKAGIKMGRLAGSLLVPDHELALSSALHPDTPAATADKENALQYLRRQPFTVADTQNGWHIVRYQGLALGWMKQLPGRINNYYPKDWRILMQQ